MISPTDSRASECDSPTSIQTGSVPHRDAQSDLDAPTAVVIRGTGSQLVAWNGRNPGSNNSNTSAQPSLSLESAKIAEAFKDMPSPGQTIHGFTIVREIGSGGYGRVFLATQENLADRFVVLKFSPDLAVESRALAKLQHTNIVPVYSIHRQGSLQVVCMPYFGTTTLQRLLRQYRDAETIPTTGRQFVDTFRRLATVPSEMENAPRAIEVSTVDPAFQSLATTSYVRAAVWIMLRLTEGMAHAHDRGILHRDIKPANILLTDDGQPMLLDFGVAEEIALRASTPDVTHGGTLAYMAPEHLQEILHGGTLADCRSDIYSLGIVFYELLTSRHPFPMPGPGGLDEIERLIVERQQGPLHSVRSLNGDVSPGLESIVNTCLAFDPNRRYPNAHALREDLYRHLNEMPLLIAPVPSISERFRKWARRHPRLSSTTTVVAVLIAIALFVGAGAWANWERLRTLEAEQYVVNFHDRARNAKQQLLVEAQRQDTLLDGLQAAHQLIESWPTGWETAFPGRQMTREQIAEVKRELMELNLLLARGHWLRAQSKTPPDADEVDAAIQANARAEVLAEGNPPRLLYTQRITMFEQLGRKADLAAAKEAFRATPLQTARDYQQAGVTELDAGRYAEAIKFFHTAQSIDPRLISAHYNEGVCHASLGRWDLARASFTSCLVLDPDAPFARYNRGVANLQLGDAQAAIEDMTIALKLLPDFPAARIARSEAYEKQELYSEALDDLETAISLGDSRDSLLKRRNYLKNQIAKRLGEPIVEVEPTTSAGWIHKGLELLPTDKDAALKAFEEAIRLDPNSSNPRMYQAHVLAETHREAECVVALTRAFELDPKNVTAVASRGVMNGRLKRYSEAIADARKALELSFAPLTLYQAACAFGYASLENPAYRAEALTLLGIALRGGFGHDHLESDPDLEPIRKTAEFKSLVETARRERPVTKP